MTSETMMQAGIVEESVKNNPFATAWLVVLGVVLTLTLLSSAILLAWPVVAMYAARLN